MDTVVTLSHLLLYHDFPVLRPRITVNLANSQPIQNAPAVVVAFHCHGLDIDAGCTPVPVPQRLLGLANAAGGIAHHSRVGVPEHVQVQVLDSHLVWIGDVARNDVMLLLYGVPTWVSTRIDTFDTLIDSCVWCPPRGLWATGASNYWGGYLKALVDHIDERGWEIHDFEIWNEANEQYQEQRKH